MIFASYGAPTSFLSLPMFVTGATNVLAWCVTFFVSSGAFAP